MKVAVVQMNSGEDKAQNLSTAERLLVEAAERGAELAVLPELFTYLGRRRGHREVADAVPGTTSELHSTRGLMRSTFSVDVKLTSSLRLAGRICCTLSDGLARSRIGMLRTKLAKPGSIFSTTIRRQHKRSSL